MMHYIKKILCCINYNLNYKNINENKIVKHNYYQDQIPVRLNYAIPCQFYTSDIRF